MDIQAGQLEQRAPVGLPRFGGGGVHGLVEEIAAFEDGVGDLAFARQENIDGRSLGCLGTIGCGKVRRQECVNRAAQLIGIEQGVAFGYDQGKVLQELTTNANDFSGEFNAFLESSFTEVDLTQRAKRLGNCPMAAAIGRLLNSERLCIE